MTVDLAPSVIAADFSRLGEHLARVEPHASRWHVDVMDGHYVPNLTIGPMFVEAIAAASSLSQDVHLMVANPDDTWEWYAKAGAARIAFHPATSSDPMGLVRRIAGAGHGVGVAINPDQEAAAFESYLEHIDHLIVMSVYPGFSGQKFIPQTPAKLRELRPMVDGRGVQLIVDGGVTLETAPACLAAGADVLVSASAIFGASDPARVAAALRALDVGRE